MRQSIVFLVVAASVAGLVGFAQDVFARDGAKKEVLGRMAVVCIPEWDISVKAKIDTGAYLVSLHVSNLTLVKKSPPTVRFRTIDADGNEHTIEARVVRHVKVRSSFGHRSQRPAVRARLCLGGREVDAVVTLADRSDMRFPMLIGRKVLKGRFIVDPARIQVRAGECCRRLTSSPDRSG